MHYLSLDFDHGPHEDFDSLTLRCFAQQTYPNGTVIYESSLATKICQERNGIRRTVEFVPRQVKTKITLFQVAVILEPEPMTGESGQNVAGVVITTIVLFFTVVAILTICISHRYKVGIAIDLIETCFVHNVYSLYISAFVLCQAKDPTQLLAPAVCSS